MKRQSGFTLIELLAVIVGFSVITMLGMEKMKADAIADHANAAAKKAIVVADQAKRFRMATGAWPASTTQLVSNGYLTAEQAESGFGTAFSLSTSGSNLVITHDTGQDMYAERLKGILPGGTRSGSTVAFRVPVPGAEASLAGLYARDGSRPLTGDMDAGGYNISNIGSIQADSVTASNWIDSDNASYNADPSSISNMNAVHASIFRDGDNTGYYANLAGHSNINTMNANRIDVDYIRDANNTYYRVDPSYISRMNYVDASIFRDRNNTGYYGNFSGNSRLNTADINTLDAGTVETNYLEITQSSNLGWSCSGRHLSKTSSGDTLVCKDGKWVQAGGKDLVMTYNQYFSSGPRYWGYNLGYHHWCTNSGVWQDSYNGGIYSRVYPSSSTLSDGRRTWYFSKQHNSARDHITCFTLQ